MRALLGASAILLSACSIVPGPTWDTVRKDYAIWDKVEHRAYPDMDTLQLSCLRFRATFTKDLQACLARTKGVCYYMTVQNDSRHDQELTAYCNGFRRS